MFYADQHMHSSVSFDSHSPRPDMAAAAVQAGLSALCFTDHYDVVDEHGAFVRTYDWPPPTRPTPRPKPPGATASFWDSASKWATLRRISPPPNRSSRNRGSTWSSAPSTTALPPCNTRITTTPTSPPPPCAISSWTTTSSPCSAWHSGASSTPWAHPLPPALYAGSGRAGRLPGTLRGHHPGDLEGSHRLRQSHRAEHLQISPRLRRRLRGHPARLSRTGRGTGHRGRRRPLPRKRGTCLPGRT